MAYRKKGDFVNLLENTIAEVYIGVIAGAILAGAISYSHESARNHSLRLAFSETSEIERRAKAEGRKVPNITDLLSKTNDFYMKHFEAWNE